MMINGLRWLTNDYIQLQRMTIEEYNIRMKAHSLKEADLLHQAIEHGLAVRPLEAVKNKKYVIREVNQIFDLKKYEEQIFGKDSRKFDRLKQVARRLKEYREEVEDNEL